MIDDARHGFDKTLAIPPFATIIKVAKKGNNIVIWEQHIVYSDDDFVHRSFVVLETEKQFNEYVKYIDTIFDGHRELHVCEV